MSNYRNLGFTVISQSSKARQDSIKGTEGEPIAEEQSQFYYDDAYPGYRWNNATQAWEEGTVDVRRIR